MERLLKEDQVAERLGLAVKTLRAWRFRGEGPEFVKLGRAVRYDPHTVESFMESRRRTSTAACSCGLGDCKKEV